MKTLSFLFILAISLTGMFGCNEEIYVEPIQLTAVRGQVVYSLNQQPIRRAAVKLLPSGRLVSTDSLGYFRFDSVLAGKYTLQASKTGYGTEAATLETSGASSQLVTIQLTDDKTQNRPPTSPTLVSPASNGSDVSRIITLHWKSTDPNHDSLTYTVLLFKGGTTTPSSSFTGLKTDSLSVTLEYSTTYLWQVIVKDGVNTVNGDIWTFKTAAFPDYSYLFVRSINSQYQIFGANTGSAGSSIVQLTSAGSNWRPISSPTKQQVAYISNIKTDLQLYVMNTDGSNAHQVTTVPISGISPADLSFCWSPDGSQLLYPSNNKLYAIRTDGTGLRIVAQAAIGRIYSGCDWTSQGNRIVARTTGTSVYDNEISLIPAGGGTATSVLIRKNYRVGNPVFSVNGLKLAVAIDSSGFQNEQGRQLDSRLCLVDLATNKLTDLSRVSGSQTLNKQAGSNDLDPRFSPDGAQLIFTNTSNTGSGIRIVYTSDIDGRNRKILFALAEMSYWRQ